MSLTKIMVFSRPSKKPSDRYFGTCSNSDSEAEEMLPLTLESQDEEAGTVWRAAQDGVAVNSSAPSKQKGRKKHRNDSSNTQGCEYDATSVDGEAGSGAQSDHVRFAGAPSEKSLAEGMRALLLPAAAIASDIAHYPLVREDGEGCTIDDLIREEPLRNEQIRAIALQIFVPFLVAGFGMVAAGMILDIVQHWPVFTNITELFVMVPALLGLKGNLEMTLAARLSTALNVGSLTPAKRWRIIGANLALTQAQAVVVGFLASVFATGVGYAAHHTVDWSHALLVCGAASVTTSIASSALGGIMVGVILLSEKYGINPDNIATPIAASLGDVITLGILSGFSRLFYSSYDSDGSGRLWYWYVGPTIVLVIVWSLLPLWIIIAKSVAQTRTVLTTGWIPVISAMLISSGSGTILEKVQSSGRKYFLGLPVFQPVINGVAGNLVAVQASRISTHLHVAYGEPGAVPADFRVCPSVCAAFCSRNYMNARTARVLLLILIPGHLIFLYTIGFLKGGHTTVTLRFVSVFIFVAFIQVAALLYIAEAMTHYVWKRGIDPDSFTIPYLTSLGDLSGTALLTFAFWFLYVTGDRDVDVGD